MSKTKTGPNMPCPCGKKKADGFPVKYKNCCQYSKKAVRPSKGTLKLTPDMLIGEPYTVCPECGKNTFGVYLFSSDVDSFLKKCLNCKHSAGMRLPEIKKKVIYLDQFVFDKIVKSLDRSHPKHLKVLEDEPYWLELYKKLEIVTRAQLVVCPDSFFHKEESSYTDYFASMRVIYERFSGGITFYPKYKVVEAQICEHFKNYLEGNADIEPSSAPESITFERDLHKWSQRVRISVGGTPTVEMIALSQEEKDRTYVRLINVFDRWRTEKLKTIGDWYEEECFGFAKATFQSIIAYKEKEKALQERLERGEEYKFEINDAFPPSSQELVEAMTWVARRYKMVDDIEIITKIGEYLFSKNIYHIPAIRIGALLFAGLADLAAKGKKDPPTKGVSVDVDMISSIMPYCEAIFVDKENATILGDGRIKPKLGVSTNIFSLKNKDEFMVYLDNIIESMSPEHRKCLESYYGESWKLPYVEILNNKREYE